MSNRWTHSMCEDCWEGREPGREPCRVAGAPPETCCFCDKRHASGIYVRAEPEAVPCRGTGGVHD
jgi:hypothetical protein